jgi:flagella basal body P-ring formation protein FlgA
MGIRSFYAALRWLKCLLAMTGVVFLTLPVQASQNWQDLDDLQQQVEVFLKDRYQLPAVERVEVKVGNLDPRLMLPACPQPLTLSLNDPTNSGGQLTVQTRCEATQRWSIYVPAQVALFRPLAVAGRQLERGDVISESDITIEVVNVSQLRQGYVIEPDNIIGRELQRPLNKGEAFRSAILEAPMVIKRGDAVHIEMQAGAIAVNSTGVAMANGRVGQRIRVRNSQSDRIVSAEVVEAGKVRTSI